MSATGIILAGGVGRRLGRDKALIEWPPDQPSGQPKRTLLDHVSATISQVCDDVLVVGRLPFREADPPHAASLENQPPPYRVIPDVSVNAGSLGGMYSGLLAARHDVSLIVATDMPFLNVQLLQWLVERFSWGGSAQHGQELFDALVPVWDGPQPLHAVYRRSCLTPLRAALDAGNLRVLSLLDALDVQYVERDELAQINPDGHSFMNVNTPEDLKRAQDVWRDLRSVRLSRV